eukprot:scaffold358530_cov37-Attheya_sp.AAC.2
MKLRAKSFFFASMWRHVGRGVPNKKQLFFLWMEAGFFNNVKEKKDKKKDERRSKENHTTIRRRIHWMGLGF